MLDAPTRNLPIPKLRAKPPPPVYPPVPTPDPFDPFLARLSIAAALAGVPVFFIARPVGVILMFAFGAAWLLIMVSQGIRREMVRKSLIKSHEAACEQIADNHEKRIQSIGNANKKLIDAWKAANAPTFAKHARLCKAVDGENRRRTACWEASKAVIEAGHQRVTREIEQANRRLLLDWEAKNDSPNDLRSSSPKDRVGESAADLGLGRPNGLPSGGASPEMRQDRRPEPANHCGVGGRKRPLDPRAEAVA